MMRNVRHTPRLILFLLAATPTACGDSSGPDEPDIVELRVSGVRVDAEAFAQTGEFELGLLARDEEGNSILNPDVEVEITLDQVTDLDPANFTITPMATTAQSPQNRPTFAAILMDNSGSMSSSDPTELRAQAARLFWEAVLPVSEENRVGFLDFGFGGTGDFTDTRLLQDWTRDETLLTAALDEVGDFGGTPLYQSTWETAEWIDRTTAAGSTNRVLLVLTDGQPNSSFRRPEAFSAIQTADITVHTVGLGPASDADGRFSNSAVQAARELAEVGGGVYASATSASALAPIFQTLAEVSSRGQLLSAFRFVPSPPSGTVVGGSVTVRSGGGSSTATWSFRVP